MRKDNMKNKINIDELEPINFNTAGIDIGSKENWVAIPSDRCEKNIRVFGVFTNDLHAMAIWLQENAIDLIVMESTGSYWIPAYDVLEGYGFTIHLVNARDVKSCPGRRKTDKNDCKWLQKLGTYGLLTPSFIAPSKVRQLQVYMHQRDSLTKNASTYIQRIQKTLSSSGIAAQFTSTMGLLLLMLCR